MQSIAQTNELVQFTNCRLIRGGRLYVDVDLWVQQGIVVDPEKIFFDKKVLPTKQIDCGGQFLAPGFIDIQINGGFGYDFTDRSNDVEESLRQVSQQLPASGVTSYCPTIVTSTPESYHEVLPRVRNYMRQVQMLTKNRESTASNILGLHLEGPFINSKKRGAHREDFIQDKSPVVNLNQLLDCYGSLENVLIVTVAPEIVDDAVIAQLNQLNIVPSIGHCCATLQQCSQALRNGARCVTHLYNAMPSFHHREPSVIGSLTLNDRINLPKVDSKLQNKLLNLNIQTKKLAQSNGYKKFPYANGFLNGDDQKCNGTNGIDMNKTVNGINGSKSINRINGICILNGKQETKTNSLPDQFFYGIICDGVHTVPAAVALAYRTYPEGCILVTDAIAPLGLEPGRVHRLGTQNIEIKENRAFIHGTDTLCGSIASLDLCVRLFVESTGCDPVQAINCATIHPASLLAMRGKKGDLTIGSDADFVLLNDQLEVNSTYIDGRLSWTKSKVGS